MKKNKKQEVNTPVQVPTPPVEEVVTMSGSFQLFTITSGGVSWTINVIDGEQHKLVAALISFLRGNRISFDVIKNDNGKITTQEY